MKKRFLGIALIVGLSTTVVFGIDSIEIKTEKAEIFACTAHEKKDSTKIETPTKELKFACATKKNTTEIAPEKTKLFAQETKSESTEKKPADEKKAEMIAAYKSNEINLNQNSIY